MLGPREFLGTGCIITPSNNNLELPSDPADHSDNRILFILVAGLVSTDQTLPVLPSIFLLFSTVRQYCCKRY
jgi:hypothetical protein